MQAESAYRLGYPSRPNRNHLTNEKSMTTETTKPTKESKASDQPIVTGVQKWFAVDSLDNMEVFDNPEDAKKYAEDALGWSRDNACDGWSEEVTNIMWGRINGRVEETLRRDRTEDDVMVPPDCDEIVDYEVVSMDADGMEFAAITDAIGCVRDRRTTAREQGDKDMEMHLTTVVEKLREIRRASR